MEYFLHSTWFVILWAAVGVVGWIFNVLANLQQLLDGGWKKFWQTVAWFLVIALALVLPCYIAAILLLRPEHNEVESADGRQFGVESGETRQPQPIHPAVVPALQPTQLPLHQRVFAPSEVLFCPDCGKAYSSKGLRDNVECAKCGHIVMLQADPNATVFRCVHCNTLFTTSYKPAYTGLFPTGTVLDCPNCKKALRLTYSKNKGIKVEGVR